MLLNDIDGSFITEDTNYECKGRLNEEKLLSWLKTVCAFTNGKEVVKSNII